MTNKIIIKNSSTSGAVPLPLDMEQGELALNAANKTLYSKNQAGGYVFEITPSSAALGSGTADETKVLRGDRTWVDMPTGGGGSSTATAVTATTTSSSANYKVPFLNTTSATTGDYGVLQDSSGNFLYNPSSNQLNNLVLGSGVTFSTGNSLPNPSSYSKGGMYGASTSNYAACGYGSGGAYYSAVLGVNAYSSGNYGVAVGAQANVENDYGVSIGRLSRSYAGATVVGHNSGNTGSNIPAALIGSQVSSQNVSSGSGVVALRGTSGSTVWDLPNSGFFVDPIRSGSASNTLMYDTNTKEIVYGESSGGGGGSGPVVNVVADNTPLITPSFAPTNLNFIQGEGIGLDVSYGSTYINVIISASGGGSSGLTTVANTFSGPVQTGSAFFDIDLHFATFQESQDAIDWFVAMGVGTIVFETDNMSYNNRYLIVLDPFYGMNNPQMWNRFSSGFGTEVIRIPQPYIYVYDYLGPTTGTTGSVTQG